MRKNHYMKKGSRILAMVLALAMTVSLGVDTTRVTNVYAAESGVEASVDVADANTADTAADGSTESVETLSEDGEEKAAADEQEESDQDNQIPDEDRNTEDEDQNTEDDQVSDDAGNGENTDDTDGAADQDTSDQNQNEDEAQDKNTDASDEETDQDEEDADEDTNPEIAQSETSSSMVLSVSEDAGTGRRIRRAAPRVTSNDSTDEDGNTSGAYDFGSNITSATFEKLENGQWVTNSSKEYTDGDSIRIALNFSIPANKVTANQKQITYDLPAGITLPKEETGYTMRQGDEGGKYAVGTYVITTDGKITIAYYDSFADGKAFTGNIQFEAKVDASAAGEDGKIVFPGDGDTITIKEQSKTYSISTKKEGSYDGQKINYKITTSTGENGTDPDKTITIEDWFSDTNAAYDTANGNSIVVKKIAANGTETTITDKTPAIETGTDGKQHFKIEGLAPLNAGERYEVTYSATPKTLETGTDGSQSVGNWTRSYDGSNSSSGGTTTIIHEKKLDKSGSYDSVNDRIKWTIVVNAGFENMSDYVVTDDLATNGLSIIDGTLTITGVDKDGNSVADGYANNTAGTSPNNLKFTFNGSAKYTIEFYTTVPDSASSDSVTQVSNKVTDDKGNSSTGTVGVQEPDWGVAKKYNYSSTGSSGSYPTVTWGVTITVPSSSNGTSEIVYKDTIHEATSSDASDSLDSTGSHYTTWTQLNAIRDSISYTVRDGANAEAVRSNISVEIKAWTDAEKTTEVASSSTDRIGCWEMTFKDADGSSGNLDKVANISFSYATTVVYDKMPNEATWIFKNTGAVGDHSSDAEFKHTKPAAIKKSAGTKIGTTTWATRNRDETSGADFKSGSSSITLNEDGTYWYRLVLSTTNTTTGDIIIKDQLPAGLSIEGLDSYLDSSSTDTWNSTTKSGGKLFRTTGSGDAITMLGDCPILIYIGDDTNRGLGGYQVARVARVHVETDSETNAQTLYITIPYEDTNRAYGKVNYQHWWGGTSDPQVPFFEILYKVTADPNDSGWSDEGDSYKATYTNNASWGTDSSETTTDVTRAKDRLIKSSEVVKDENGEKTTSVKYSIVINPLGEDLNSEGDFLTLTDTLGTLQNGVNAKFLLGDVELYRYDSSKDGNLGDELGKDLFKISDLNETAHSFKVTVPDGLACVLVYQYDFDMTSLSSGTAANITNSASLNGKWSKSNEQKVVAQSSSSNVSYDTVYVYKVDADDYNTRLAGVSFKLESFQAAADNTTNGTWEQIKGGHGDGGLYVTDETGKLTLKTDQNSTTDAKLNKNVLYRLTEQNVGSNTGYQVDRTPIYFMISDSESEAKSSFDELGQSVPDNLGGTGTVSFSDVKVCLVKYNGFAEIYVPNKNTSLTVKKVWLDKDGNVLSSEKANKQNSIQVQLVQNTVKPGTDGWNVTLKLDYTGTSYGVEEKKILVEKGGRVVVTSVSSAKNDSDYSVPEGWTIVWNQRADYSGWDVVMTSPEITSDVEYKLGRSWGYYNQNDYRVTWDKPNNVISSEDLGSEVTLNESNSWSYTWDGTDPKLPAEGSNGETYTYSVREVSTGAYVTTIYGNGVTSGTITVYNRLKETYELPETGGSGTLPWTVGGSAALISAFLAGIALRRKSNKYSF